MVWPTRALVRGCDGFSVEIALEPALASEAWIGKPKIGLDHFKWNVKESSAAAQVLHMTASFAKRDGTANRAGHRIQALSIQLVHKAPDRIPAVALNHRPSMQRSVYECQRNTSVLVRSRSRRELM